jgi:hypothetical protein
MSVTGVFYETLNERPPQIGSFFSQATCNICMGSTNYDPCCRMVARFNRAI